MIVAMIARGVSHQTLHVILGHNVVDNVKKFQSCICDTLFLIDEKLSQK